MNRFPMNPHLRYPQQTNFRKQMQPAMNFKSMIPSQHLNYVSQSMDTRFNDDAISIASETTYMQGPSQDNFTSFKSELCEMFKTLIETTQLQFGTLVESVKTINHNGLSLIKNEIITQNCKKQEILETIETKNFDKIKNQIVLIKEENFKCNQAISKEIQVILESVKKLEFPVKRKNKRRRTLNYEVLYYKPLKKRDQIPCDCYFKHPGYKTNSQILRAIACGDLKCLCN